MRLLFLRGQVPKDRDPRQIMFDRLEDCDDVWTQYAYELCRGGYGEVWYWGGNRTTKYKPTFIERWIPDFNSYQTDYKPNVIFCRGGFKEYDIVCERYPKAIKIYYGAGSRFYPQHRFKNFHVILNDTTNQQHLTQSLFPNTSVDLFIKPVAENIFKPVPGKKKFDVIMVGNYNHLNPIKGHEMLDYIPMDLKVIQVGINRGLDRRLNVSYLGWIPRKQIPILYGNSKVAIVCCDKKDSSPRVIPEALACNCPVLVLDGVDFWKEKYITPQTGRLCSRKDFRDVLYSMVESYVTFSPREYYEAELSLSKSISKLKNLIDTSRS